MKKVIIGVSGLLVLAFIVILTVGAQSKDTDKQKTVAQKECSKCSSSAACTGQQVSDAKTACDPATCKEGKCDPEKCKEGKCDPEKCSGKCKETATASAKCDPATCIHHKTVVN